MFKRLLLLATLGLSLLGVIPSAQAGGMIMCYGSAGGGTTWYNSNWSKRAPITITNSGSALADYQIKATVTYNSNMQANFNDIRFTTSDKVTEINYWLESYATSTSATFWIKVPSIAATPTTTTIYMYYGNASAATASNGTNTFEFFDDFSDSLLTNWTNNGSGTWIATDGVLKQTSLGYDSTGIWTSNFSGTDYIFESIMRWTNVYISSGEQLGPLVRASASNCYGAMYNRWDGTTNNFQDQRGAPRPITPVGSANTPPYGTMMQNVWYNFKWQIVGTSLKTKTWQYETTEPSQWLLENTDSNVTSGGVGFSTWVTSIEVDNVRVRQYASAEPTTSIGAEESH